MQRICFSRAGTERPIKLEEKMNAAMYRDILGENLLQSTPENWGNDPKHRAKISDSKNNSVKDLQWPNQSPDLNPIEHLWRKAKMAVHRHFPSNLMELERCC